VGIGLRAGRNGPVRAVVTVDSDGSSSFLRVFAGEQDGEEPGDDDERGSDAQGEQYQVERDGKQPLVERLSPRQRLEIGDRDDGVPIGAIVVDCRLEVEGRVVPVAPSTSQPMHNGTFDHGTRVWTSAFPRSPRRRSPALDKVGEAGEPHQVGDRPREPCRPHDRDRVRERGEAQREVLVAPGSCGGVETVEGGHA